MTPLTKTNHLTLKMTSIQLVKTSVVNNSSFHQNSLTQTITLYELPIILGLIKQTFYILVFFFVFFFRVYFGEVRFQELGEGQSQLQ